jgi:predicted Rossmann fold flavoprotein
MYDYGGFLMKVCIIGAGASGLVAAISAKEHGADVFLLERNSKIGRKILATGNGRCNFTNVDATSNHYNHPSFVNPIFEQFGPDKTVKFFERLGIEPKIEDEGKTYPLSEQASSIVDVLAYELEKLSIKVFYETLVDSISIKNNQYHIKSREQTYIADKVIVATGGKALPKSGSDGNGYVLAQSLNHDITPIYPSLVKLKLDYPYLKQMDGVKIKASAELMHNNVSLHYEYGDVLFTKYGISGPTILQISRKANELLYQKEEIYIKVSIIKNLDFKDLIERFKNFNERTIEMALIGLVHKKLIHPLLKEANIHDFQKIVKKVDHKKLMKLIHLLLDWRFLVIGSKDYDEAQVTAGGIKIDDIDPMTLESKIHKGLYFTGEVLDIDALCGGYNLQWAWSSGYIAGKYASKT